MARTSRPQHAQPQPETRWRPKGRAPPSGSLSHESDETRLATSKRVRDRQVGRATLAATLTVTVAAIVTLPVRSTAVAASSSMTIGTLPGVQSAQLVQHLEGALTALVNVRTGASTPFDLYNAYLTWANEQLRMLRYTLTPTALDQVVTTRRHWALVNLDPVTMGSALRAFVEVEIDEQVRVLEASMAEVRREIDRHSAVDAFLVPDTNVYVHGEVVFDQVPWLRFTTGEQRHLRLLVPLVVIDELDRLKNRGSGTVREGSKETVRARARATLRTLEGLFSDPANPVFLSSPNVDGPDVSIAVVFDDPGHVRLPDADSEIIDRAQAVTSLTARPATVVTLDLGMALRARLAGLMTAEPPEPNEQ